MNQPNDYIVTDIEREYNVRAIESEAKGLYYLEDDEKKYLGIMTVRKGKANWIVLNKKQIKALIKEIKDI